MAFINRLSVDEDTGRAFVTTDAPSSTDPYMAGIRFADDGSMRVQNTAVSGATFQDGYARDDNGVLFVRIDDPPTGSDAVFNDGILGDTTGRMSMTTTNPIAGYSHGWPVDAAGSVCIIGTTPPPVEVTFDNMRIILPATFGTADSIWAGDIYFGSSGTETSFYTSEAAFTAAHPGLTHYQLANLPPPPMLTDFSASQPVTLTTGLVLTSAVTPSNGAILWSDSTASPPITPRAFLSQDVSAPFPFLAYRFNFSPPVNSAGLNWRKGTGQPETGDVTFEIYDGTTLLFSNTTTSAGAAVHFNGYSSATGGPTVDTRITGDTDIRITGDGDNRITV